MLMCIWAKVYHTKSNSVLFATTIKWEYRGIFEFWNKLFFTILHVICITALGFVGGVFATSLDNIWSTMSSDAAFGRLWSNLHTLCNTSWNYSVLSCKFKTKLQRLWKGCIYQSFHRTVIQVMMPLCQMKFLNYKILYRKFKIST